MKYTFAAVAPLIGGNPLGAEIAFGGKPEYAFSYPGFWGNDKHYVNHSGVQYYVDQLDMLTHVDAVVGCLPCAGLSSLSPSSSSDSKTNDYMVNSAQDVLSLIKPKVFWGENAPRLASTMGKPVVEKLRKIGEEYGYTFSLIKTKSLHHGLSQVRERSFYFFWKGDSVPVFNYVDRPNERIEDLLSMKLEVDDPMNVLVRKEKPSDNPFYRFVLEKEKRTHVEFCKELPYSKCILDHIEENYSYEQAAEWLTANGFEREAARAIRMHNKLKAGQNIMRRETYLVKNKIGAFVGHLPTQIAHPYENRYLTYRECLRIMKMPEDFILLDKEKSINHICQNVPVTTASDMAKEVVRFLNGESELIKTKFMIQNNVTKRIEHIERDNLELNI